MIRLCMHACSSDLDRFLSRRDFTSSKLPLFYSPGLLLSLARRFSFLFGSRSRFFCALSVSYLCVRMRFFPNKRVTLCFCPAINHRALSNYSIFDFSFLCVRPLFFFLLTRSCRHCSGGGARKLRWMAQNRPWWLAAAPHISMTKCGLNFATDHCFRQRCSLMRRGKRLKQWWCARRQQDQNTQFVIVFPFKHTREVLNKVVQIKSQLELHIMRSFHLQACLRKC